MDETALDRIRDIHVRVVVTDILLGKLKAERALAITIAYADTSITLNQIALITGYTRSRIHQIVNATALQAESLTLDEREAFIENLPSLLADPILIGDDSIETIEKKIKAVKKRLGKVDQDGYDDAEQTLVAIERERASRGDKPLGPPPTPTEPPVEPPDLPEIFGLPHD